jgi:hypothetical protein
METESSEAILKNAISDLPTMFNPLLPFWRRPTEDSLQSFCDQNASAKRMCQRLNMR